MNDPEPAYKGYIPPNDLNAYQSPHMPPQHYKPPSTMIGNVRANSMAPQSSQPPVSSPALPVSPVHEDSLPAMPVWDPSHRRINDPNGFHVEEEDDITEMAPLNGNGTMTDAAGPGYVQPSGNRRGYMEVPSTSRPQQSLYDDYNFPPTTTTTNYNTPSFSSTAYTPYGQGLPYPPSEYSHQPPSPSIYSRGATPALPLPLNTAYRPLNYSSPSPAGNLNRPPSPTASSVYSRGTGTPAMPLAMPTPYPSAPSSTAGNGNGNNDNRLPSVLMTGTGRKPVPSSTRIV